MDHNLGVHNLAEELGYPFDEDNGHLEERNGGDKKVQTEEVEDGDKKVQTEDGGKKMP